MRAREQEVREKTIALRQKRVDRWNKRNREPPGFGPDKGQIGYRHPPNKGSCPDPGWVGPLDVRSLLWTGVREFTAHASMMKESYDPGFGAPVATLSSIGFSKRAKLVEEPGPEFEADCIMGNRKVHGLYEFLTTWKGYRSYADTWKGYRSDGDTWEPLGNFFHGYSSDLVKYATSHELGNLAVVKYLQSEPDEVVVLQAARKLPGFFAL